MSTVSESVLPLAYIISSRTEEEKSPSPLPIGPCFFYIRVSRRVRTETDAKAKGRKETVAGRSVSWPEMDVYIQSRWRPRFRMHCRRRATSQFVKLGTSRRERNVDAASIPRDDWRDPDIVATSASSILSSSSSYSAGCACVRADVFQQSSGSSSSNPILGFLFLQAHFCCVDQSTIESTAGGGGGHVCATRTGEKILP